MIDRELKLGDIIYSIVYNYKSLEPEFRTDPETGDLWKKVQPDRRLWTIQEEVIVAIVKTTITELSPFKLPNNLLDYELPETRYFTYHEGTHKYKEVWSEEIFLTYEQAKQSIQ